MNYEEIVNRIDKITKELENPNIELDKAVNLFSESVSLIKTAYEQLADAKGKITILKQDLDKFVEVPFD